jgi:hypothetical protein
MFSLEDLMFAIIFGVGFFIIAVYVVSRFQRKVDVQCFLVGIAIVEFFLIFLFPISTVEQFPSLISSLVIAELTLALVWVELSKRPELEMSDLSPIIRDKHSTGIQFKAGYHKEPSFYSRLFKIREVCSEDLKFDEYFSFAFDLSNIGYGEIMVHDYEVYIDGKKQSTFALGMQPKVKRLRLITQQREPIDIPALYIKTTGFHRIDVRVSAMTAKCSKEVWFFISGDFKKLRYVNMIPLKRLFSPIIKAKLKSGMN